MSTFETLSTTNFPTTQTTSVVITKPSGLAEGDLMVAILAKSDNVSTSDIDTASGWTYQGEQKDVNSELNVQTKFATAGDVAASNFTFTADEACSLSGTILRISGAGRVEGVEFDKSGGTTTISYTGNITPIVANSLIITTFYTTGFVETFSTYTITPSLTLTERAEYGNSSAPESPYMAITTGVYSGTSTITQYGCTLTAGGQDSGILLVITPRIDANVDVSHIAVTPTVSGITASNDVMLDISHLNVEPTLYGIATVNSSDSTQWNNPDKPSTTWNNLDK